MVIHGHYLIIYFLKGERRLSTVSYLRNKKETRLAGLSGGQLKLLEKSNLNKLRQR